jgi:hypothetical protein
MKRLAGVVLMFIALYFILKTEPKKRETQGAYSESMLG